MKKLVGLIIFIFVFFLFPSAIQSATTTVVANSFAFESSFQSYTYDNLVFDFTIDAASENVLTDMVMVNNGSARDNFEIEKVVLWRDNDNGVFDGFFGDIRLSVGEYNQTYKHWIFDYIGKHISVGENRFFVSVETGSEKATGRTFDFAIPSYNDIDDDELYDLGETGVYLYDYKLLPLKYIETNGFGRYNYEAVEYIAPDISSYLQDGDEIVSDPYLIRGKARDQGGSHVTELQVCIDGECHDAVDIGNNYSVWEYEWSGIEIGEHEIYLSVQDERPNINRTAIITVNHQSDEKEKIVELINSTVTVDRYSAFADGSDSVEIAVVIKNVLDNFISYKDILLMYDTGKDDFVYATQKTDEVGETVFKVTSDKVKNFDFYLKTQDNEVLLTDIEVSFVKLEEDESVDTTDFTDGEWVKLTDSDTVYFLDDENVRHAYPTLGVWESYFGADFSFVETITVHEMSGYSLGRNVTFKSGTLMKIPSIAKVYLVGDGGLISWLESEKEAISLYGEDWADLVYDLSEGFFGDYVE